MTVQFRAANAQHIGWVKLTVNTIAGFLVLWLFVAVVFGRVMSLSR